MKIIRNHLISSIQDSFEAIPKHAHKDLDGDQYDAADKLRGSMLAERVRHNGLGRSVTRILVSTDIYETPPDRVIAINFFENVEGPLGSRRIQEVGGLLEHELSNVELARSALMMRSLARTLGDT